MHTPRLVLPFGHLRTLDAPILNHFSSICDEFSSHSAASQSSAVGRRVPPFVSAVAATDFKASTHSLAAAPRCLDLAREVAVRAETRTHAAHARPARRAARAPLTRRPGCFVSIFVRRRSAALLTQSERQKRWKSRSSFTTFHAFSFTVHKFQVSGEARGKKNSANVGIILYLTRAFECGARHDDRHSDRLKRRICGLLLIWRIVTFMLIMPGRTAEDSHTCNCTSTQVLTQTSKNTLIFELVEHIYLSQHICFTTQHTYFDYLSTCVELLQ